MAPPRHSAGQTTFISTEGSIAGADGEKEQDEEKVSQRAQGFRNKLRDGRTCEGYAGDDGADFEGHAGRVGYRCDRQAPPDDEQENELVECVKASQQRGDDELDAEKSAAGYQREGHHDEQRISQDWIAVATAKTCEGE